MACRSSTSGYLRDQAPAPGDAGYWDRLYSLEITPGHVAAGDAIVIFRPWVKAGAFAEGAGALTVIGSAGAGIDKIDLGACTAHDVAVFNAPDTLTHATASSAFLLMLALAKRLPTQQALVRSGRWDLQPQAMGVDLPGKVLGIVGLGASGRELARLAEPWGMGSAPFRRGPMPRWRRRSGWSWCRASRPCSRRPTSSACTTGWTPATRGLIGAAEFRR